MTKNWTKEELEQREQEKGRKKRRLEKLEAMKSAEFVADELEKETPRDHPIALTGLSDRQKLVARLRMRGLTQNKIAEILKISQPVVSRELNAIKKKQGLKVEEIMHHSDVVVGEALTVYEEVGQEAWKLYHTNLDDPGTQTKALSLVMSAQDKQNKLMMDLGIIQRASKDVTVKFEVPAVIQNLKKPEVREAISTHIIEAQYEELDAPEPPQLEAELHDEDDDNEEGSP